MTNDPPGGMPGRRPPTIDAIASEIESWPVTKEAAASQASVQSSAHEARAADVAPATDLAHDAVTESPSMEASQEQPASSAEPSNPPPPATPPTTASTTRPKKEPRQGVGFLGVVGAALIGGAVAAALALFLIDRLPLRDDGARGLDTRLIRAEHQLREIAAHPQPADAKATDKALEELAARLARLEAAPPPSPAPPPAPAAAPAPAADPALAGRIAKLEADTKVLGDSIVAHGRRADETAALARAAQERANTSATALADLAKRPPAPPAVERSEVEALAARVADLAKKPSDAADRSVRLALAAVQLRGAVDRGEPFTAELTAAKALTADPKVLAPLEPLAATGVPTAPVLARELTALAPAIHAAVGVAPAEGSFLERLQANAQKIVRIRPVEEIPGDEATAVIARIEVKAGRGDFAGALAELPKLPEPARAAAEPWAKRAQARVAAIEASRSLAADALAGLGK